MPAASASSAAMRHTPHRTGSSDCVGACFNACGVSEGTHVTVQNSEATATYEGGCDSQEQRLCAGLEQGMHSSPHMHARVASSESRCTCKRAQTLGGQGGREPRSRSRLQRAEKAARKAFEARSAASSESKGPRFGKWPWLASGHGRSTKPSLALLS